ncbi:MAG TPA: hypothetical protein DCE41_24455, partial [Cytophagales bacterium]|nr:hypothetical protein [Cytophagales bacterium]
MVTSTADDGSTGTLRWAVNQSNANNGSSIITFQIPDSFKGPFGLYEIRLGSKLSITRDSVTIDATTQMEYTSTPVIAIVGASNTFDGIEVNNASSFACFGLRIDGFDDGIYLVGVSESGHRIGEINKGNLISNNNRHGISFTHPNHSHTSIIGNRIQFNGVYGMHINKFSNSQIKNNTITHNGNNGIYAINIDNSHIKDNSISENNGYGIFVETISGNTFMEENDFESNQYSGLVIDETSYGFYIRNNIFRGNGNYGIYTREPCNFFQIENCLIQNNNNEGIYFRKSCSQFLIKENSINNNSRGINWGESCTSFQLRKNKIFCNNNGSFSIVQSISVPIINSANCNGISGITLPHAVVDLFIADSCFINEPNAEHYEGTVTADASGNFTYAGTIRTGKWSAIATDTVSLLSSTLSTSVQVTCSGSVPASPTNFNAGMVNSSIQLAWTDVSSNEETFYIFRRQVGHPLFQRIASTTANATSYQDATALDSANIYQYKVIAVNGAGESSSSEIIQIQYLPNGGGPTCSDGIQNGDETGIDCGGSCIPCGNGVTSPDWAFTATNSSHTILLQSAATPTVDGTPISIGDYVGVFYDSAGYQACGGMAVWTGSNSIIAAFGNDDQTPNPDGFEDNETFRWRVWLKETQEELPASATYESLSGAFTHQAQFSNNGISGLASLAAYRSYDLSIEAGWNLISLPIAPTPPQVDSILAPVNSEVVIMKNAVGGTYWPQYGINSISDWDYQEGYIIKMTNPVTVSVAGSTLSPADHPLHLSSGWNLIPYLRQTSMTTAVALGSLSQINLIKDITGKIYWPAFGVNDLDSLHPGEAYWANLFDADTLTYPSNNVMGRGQRVDEPRPALQHYPETPATPGSLVLGIPESVASQWWQPGDEVAAFDSELRCVGAVVYTGGALAWTLREDVAETATKEGLTIGEAFTLRSWSATLQQEQEVLVTRWDHAKGGTYETHGIQIAEELQAVQVSDFHALLFPNPSSRAVTLGFTLPGEGTVSGTVVNAKGQIVHTWPETTHTAGYHRWELTDGTLAP